MKFIHSKKEKNKKKKKNQNKTNPFGVHQKPECFQWMFGLVWVFQKQLIYHRLLIIVLTIIDH